MRGASSFFFLSLCRVADFPLVFTRRPRALDNAPRFSEHKAAQGSHQGQTFTYQDVEAGFRSSCSLIRHEQDVSKSGVATANLYGVAHQDRASRKGLFPSTVFSCRGRPAFVPGGRRRHSPLPSGSMPNRHGGSRLCGFQPARGQVT